MTLDDVSVRWGSGADLAGASEDARLRDAIERAARQEPAVRAAMRMVRMGSGVASNVKQRFAKYGARDQSGNS
ncbi:hypothetical protein [Cryptosporangium arvum]|uniref:hypothetical protein n=1 Tax=Cryptosporangium arvum TaxID=80871 RepID=UPI0004B75A45|nr:hypothetical protein [Cryptosporangium arvum]